MEPTPSQNSQATDRLIVTFSRFTRDSFMAQIEAFSTNAGLRCRYQEERGSASSLFVIHLRGDPAAIDRVKDQVRQLSSTELLLLPQRRQLPRAAISAVSFFIGLGLVAGLFYLAS